MKQVRESISMIASGYEWICPNCDDFQKEIEIVQEVKCRNCGAEYEVSEVSHAYK